jgi:hypothetical protein
MFSRGQSQYGFCCLEYIFPNGVGIFPFAQPAPSAIPEMQKGGLAPSLSKYSPISFALLETP